MAVGLYEANPDELPAGNVEGLNADAQAILELAPSLEEGLVSLSDAYGGYSWNSPEEAKQITTQYSDLLRNRFKDNSLYSPTDLLQLLPVPIDKVNGEGEDTETKKIDQINKWEASNLEALNKIEQPDFLVGKNKLQKSLENYASKQRQQINTSGDSNYADLGYRMLEGATGSIAKSLQTFPGVGEYAKDWVQWLQENQKDAQGEDYTAYVAKGLSPGVGFMGGAMSTTTAGATIGGVFGGPPGAAIGGTIGLTSYLVTSGIGEIADQYRRAFDETGDKSNAFNAAAIQSANQGVQLALGVKGFSGFKGAIQKWLGKEVAPVTQAVTKALPKSLVSTVNEFGGQAAVGTALTNVANQVGAGEAVTGEQTVAGVGEATAFGIGLGGIVKGAESVVNATKSPFRGKDQPAPGITIEAPDNAPLQGNKKKGTVIGATLNEELTANPEIFKDLEPSFETVTGDKYYEQDDGSVIKVTANGKVYNPLDKTVFVTEETAATIALNNLLPEGHPEKWRVSVENGEVVVRGKTLDYNLQQDAATYSSRTSNGESEFTVRLPKEDSSELGLQPLEVNEVKDHNGNTSIYQLAIGHKITKVNTIDTQTKGGSVGAAKTFERKTGERLRTASTLSDHTRGLFGDDDAGYLRDVAQTTQEQYAKADKNIAEHGIEGATNELLNMDTDNLNTTWEATSHKLFEFYDTAKENALAEGNIEAYEKISTLIGDIGRHIAETGTTFGRAGALKKEFAKKLSPETYVAGLRGKLNEKAVQEVASEEGITVKDVENIDKNIEQITQEVETVNKEYDNALSQEEQFSNKEIAEVDSIIDTIEESAQKELDEAIQSEEALISRAEEEISTIETRAEEASKTETTELTKQEANAKTRIRDLETQAQKLQEENTKLVTELESKKKYLEEKGLKKAQAQKEKDIKTAESALAKLKENKEKGAKVKDETVAREEENLKTLKEKAKKVTAEEGLTPEERQALKKLNKKLESPKPSKKEDTLSTAEKKELDNLKDLLNKVKDKKEEAKNKTIPEKDKLKVDKLKKFIEDKKAVVKGATLDSVLKARDKTLLSKLREKRSKLSTEAKERFGERKQALSDEQKERVRELLKKKERLNTVKDKVAKKKQERQKSLGPEKETRLKKLKKLATQDNLPEEVKSRADKDIADMEVEVLKDADKKVEARSAVKEWFKTFWKTREGNFISNLLHLLTPLKQFSDVVNMSVVKPAALTVGLKPREAKAYIEGLDLKQGWYGFTNALLTGNTKEFGGGDYLATGPAGLRWVGVVPRFIAAVGESIYRTATGAEFKARYYNKLRSDPDISSENMQKHIADGMFDASKRLEEAMKEARSYSDVLKKNSKDGKGLTERQIRLTAGDIFLNKFGEDFKEKVEFASLKAATANQPTGVAGQLYQVFTKAKELHIPLPYNLSFYPLKPMLPFLRIGFNVVNTTKDFVFGTVTSLYKTDLVAGKDFLDTRQKDSIERTVEFGRGVIGVTLMAGMAGLVHKYKDEDDPPIWISGAGPDSAQLRAQNRAKGINPMSIKYGTKTYSFKDTFLELPLGIIGTYADKLRYDKNFDPSSIDQMITGIMSAVIRPLMTQSTFKATNDLWQALNDPDKGSAPSKILDALVFSRIKGHIPGYGTLRSVINPIFNDPIDTSKDYWSRLVSGIPYAQNIGTRPALNYFADPVKTNYEDKFGFLGIFGYGSTDQDNIDPEWRFLAQNNYSLPQNQTYTIPLGLAKHQSVARKREDLYGAKLAGVLSPDERYELIQAAGPKMKAVVTRYMNTYGYSGHQEKVQEKLKEDISKVWNDTKNNLFLR